MSRNVKFLIGGLAAIVVLVGAIMALKLTEKPAEQPEAPAPESRLQYEKSADKIESISVETPADSYTIIKDRDSFKIDGVNASLNEEALAVTAESASRLVTEKVIEENASDLKKYGLNPPKLKITVKFSDSAKTEKTLLLGTELLDSTLSYFAFEGENTVYAVKNADFSAFAQSAEAYISAVEEETSAPQE